MPIVAPLSLTILVVDDDDQARFMMSELVSYMGHVPITASDGAQALAKFAAEAPDIVLMDVMMPGMDGYETTAQIRKLPTERWVPVVFLSALERSNNLLKGLEAGGDDYLEKPVNLSELRVKIRALQRVAVLQMNLADKRRQLEAYYQQSEEDARIGGHIMGRLVSTEGLRDDAVQYWTRPLQHFSGDLIAAARTPGNVLHLMLADAAGHGLPAALNVLPLADIFYDMTANGFPLGRIIVALDKKIKHLFPINRFVAATLLSIDAASHEIHVWNGGNPAPLLIEPGGTVSALAGAARLPLGLLENHGPDAQPIAVPFHDGAQIMLCSDGLSEAQSYDGSIFCTRATCESAARTPPARRLSHIVDAFERHLALRPIQDDVSLMLVDVLGAARGAAMPQVADAARTAPQAEGSGWKMAFRFGARELRSVDVIPFLTGVLETLEPHTAYRRQIFMILSELFNNALEHGLLRLDSSLKSSADGFEAYLLARMLGLNALATGSIEVTLEEVPFEQRAALRIVITDSGEGFDLAALRQPPPARQPHGRGLFLVESMCLALHFSGRGNTVECHCPL